MRFVLDTNVIVAGLRSPTGASAALIDRALSVGRSCWCCPWRWHWNTRRSAASRSSGSPAAAVERIGVQRQLLTEKVATSVAVLTLAVGIGASTAVFTVISIVLRPLPVAEPDRLARLHLGDPQEDA